MKKLLHGITTLLAVSIVWQLVASFGGWNKALLPHPLDVWQAFIELCEEGTLYAGIADSMMRFALGYGTAVAAGIVLGLPLGWFRGVWSFINPLIQLLRPISPMAWLPFIVLWFGIGNMPAIVIIFIAAFFPVLLTTVAAVGKVDQTYLKVARNFGIGQPYVLTTIVFPVIFPSIVTGLRLALGTAWVFLVAGEMVGAQTGLGYLIIDARNNLRADMLLADIIVIGAIGLALDSFIGLAERKVLYVWGATPAERSA